MRHKVLITRPKMPNDDATARTYHWANGIIKECNILGYDIQDLKKDEVTYENVSYSLSLYNPHLYIHFGHGCVANLVGQKRCIVTNGTQNYIATESYLANYGYRLDDDIVCDIMCGMPSNVQLLKDKMVVAYACHSAKRLGLCAIKSGAKAYAGFNDYLIFIVDNKGSENIFKDPILTFSYSLLNGDTLGEATYKTLDKFDYNIKKYKSYKILAKLLLWNRKAFTVYGNPNITVFD